jgi:predicted GIY-YIG superfamily endonuclease
MHEKFRATIETLVPAYDRLVAMEPIRGSLFPRVDLPADKRLRGVYLMTEGKQHLYVGRSNDIAGRFYAHRRKSSGDGVAPFAFRLACLSSGRTGISYIRGHEDTREEKMKNEVFLKHFANAKARICEMDFRYVIEADPVNQAILEVYCAVALETPHNTFDNH